MTGLAAPATSRLALYLDLIRWSRPAGWLLLLWPTLAALWIAADGYFWFVARRKDIIRKRGENIAGAELDGVIEAHPQVLQAAVIPVPDALGEDEILAAVQPRPGSALQPADIAAWCRERLAPIKVPRYVVFVDHLPLTPTHRVAKYRLREQAEALRARATDLAGQ